jgi:thiamine biosynthesis lipoprotein
MLGLNTGYPSHGPRGVALISDKLEDSNGLGTSIMVSGMQTGQSRVSARAGVDAMIVDADNRLWLSAGMTGRLYRV